MPSPPLSGGIATGIAILLGTELVRASSIQSFNTWNTADPNRSMGQRRRYRRVASLRFLATALNGRPQTLHVKAALGIDYYQNSTCVLIARPRGRRILLQLHAGDFSAFYDRASPRGQATMRGSLRVPHRFGELAGSRAADVVRNAPVDDANALTARSEQLAEGAALRDRTGNAAIAVALERSDRDLARARAMPGGAA
jgi:hypothetical protein